MSGVAVRQSRAELAAEVARLRADGLLQREIVVLLGISKSYVGELESDPDGAKVRARKDSYRGTCSRCGARTDGSNGRGKAPGRCAPCRAVEQHEGRYWTAERVINAIQRFAAIHGRPPTSRDWLRVENGYPVFSSVYVNSGSPNAPFPKWADAIEAAGFPRPQQSVYAHEGERGLRHIQRSVLVVLRAQRAQETTTEQIIRKAACRHRQSVYYALRSLERRGLAHHVRRGYWTAT